MLHPNSMDALIRALRATLCHYLRLGSGVLVIGCKPCPRTDGELEFQVLLYGWPRHFCIPLSQLKRYISQREAQPPAASQSDPFAVLEETVLRVLQEGGFGSIWLEFKPEKKGGVVLILEQRLSKRYSVRK